MYHVLEESFVVDLHLGDHVAGHEAALSIALSPVEAVRVLLPHHLETKIDRARSLYFLHYVCHHFYHTLINCPSEKLNSSSHASGLGDIVGGS